MFWLRFVTHCSGGYTTGRKSTVVSSRGFDQCPNATSPVIAVTQLLWPAARVPSRALRSLGASVLLCSPESQAAVPSPAETPSSGTCLPQQFLSLHPRVEDGEEQEHRCSGGDHSDSRRGRAK